MLYLVLLFLQAYHCGNSSKQNNCVVKVVLGRALNTWFPFASGLDALRRKVLDNSLAHSSIGTPSSRKSLRSRDSDSLQAYGFRYYFIALAGLLFNFPSRYLFTIDDRWYLALPARAGSFPRTIHFSRYSSKIQKVKNHCRLRGYYPLWPAFPGPFF